jgi:hypothetical protein
MPKPVLKGAEANHGQLKLLLNSSVLAKPCSFHTSDPLTRCLRRAALCAHPVILVCAPRVPVATGTHGNHGRQRSQSH